MQGRLVVYRAIMGVFAAGWTAALVTNLVAGHVGLRTAFYALGVVVAAWWFWRFGIRGRPRGF
jgi:hypothetical protein